jgi:hypothetical protein
MTHNGNLAVDLSFPLAALLLVALESYMTPSRQEYIKTPTQTGGSSYFLIEKSPEKAFFIKTFNNI